MSKTIPMKRYLSEYYMYLLLWLCLLFYFEWVAYRKAEGIPLAMLIINAGILRAFLLFADLIKPIFLFSLDLFHGPIEKEVYASGGRLIENYEFHGKRYYCEWHVYYGSTGKMYLIVPVWKRYDEILDMEMPQENQRIRICYYPYSKILKSWEALPDDGRKLKKKSKKK